MSATASTAASSACSSSFASPLELCAKGLLLPQNPALAKALEKESLIDDVLHWRAGHSRSTSADSAACFFGVASDADLLSIVGLSSAASERDDDSRTERESHLGDETTEIANDLDHGLATNEASAQLGFVVRNTFLSTPQKLLRSPSLGAFFRERQVMSCPGTRAPSPESDRPAASAGPGYPCEEVDATPSSPQKRQVLRLDDVLKQPAMGSAELPTAGSANHRFGICKPCAFAHTKGCENGVDCQFCHLCIPGEKKRRATQRVNTRRVIVVGAVAGAASPSPTVGGSLANSFTVSSAALATTPARDVASPAGVDSRFLPEVSPMAAALLRQPKFKFC